MSDQSLTPGALLLQAIGGIEPELSLRELDRLARKSEGHSQAITTNVIKDPRTSTLRRYEEVLGLPKGSLAAGGAIPLPSVATRTAAVAACRQLLNPGALGHTCNDFTPAPAAPVDDDIAEDEEPSGPVIVTEGYSQVVGG